jgi:hypothetical protein
MHASGSATEKSLGETPPNQPRPDKSQAQRGGLASGGTTLWGSRSDINRTGEQREMFPGRAKTGRLGKLVGRVTKAYSPNSGMGRPRTANSNTGKRKRKYW